MKIKSLTIGGFRGFSQEQTVEFHDRLTLIYGPNSYGKTSISEALEWLLYGITSKVRYADSKDEYKGSYWNCHWANSTPPFVKARFSEGDREIVFTGELGPDDAIRRYIDEGHDRVEVAQWPLGHETSEIPHPFVLQHALKNLLLTKPADRFRGFASLLGLEDLSALNEDIISLCTASDRCLPKEIVELRARVGALQARIDTRSGLSSLQKAFKKPGSTAKTFYDAVTREAKLRVPPGTTEASLLAELLKIRERAVSKVFEGHLTLYEDSEAEKRSSFEDESFFVDCLASEFNRQYMELAQLTTLKDVLDRIKFFELGTALMPTVQKTCPFCGQALSEMEAQHITAEHNNLRERAAQGNALQSQREKVKETLRALRTRLAAYHARRLSKAQSLLAIGPSLDHLRSILVPAHEEHFDKVARAISDLSMVKHNMEVSYGQCLGALESLSSSVDALAIDFSRVQALVQALVLHVANSRSYTKVILANAASVKEADEVLQRELDVIAGTEDVSILIDLLNHRGAVEKKLEIDMILSNLKELRKAVDQYVSHRIQTAISTELTSEVMHWYSQVRTVGDPDVHFDGFDMERTQKGDIKARRVQIKASSYGTDLVSAVSSLSESKLNALGLCVSIATNVKAETPFEFLVIDDPIQSLDADHETQFIGVIRELAEARGKQVILLSHNRRWLDLMCMGCQSLNGWFYEITGYTKAGPHISLIEWVKWKERLQCVSAILDDPKSTSIALQQAEEEIRIVVADLTSKIYKKVRGVHKSPNDLNAKQVSMILLKCGLDKGLIDRVVQTFGTTDEAHHAPTGHSLSKQRIRSYHSWAHELGRVLEQLTV